MRVLLVEDDEQLREGLKACMNKAGFAVSTAADGRTGEFLGATENFDVAVLDLGLPEIPGLDVLRSWRAAGLTLPVLILTARDAWHERIDGLKAGADDYLGKPFNTEELCLRIQGLAKRHHGHPPTEIRCGRLRLNETDQVLETSEGALVPLTAQEFRLLRCLMLRPGKIVSKTALSEAMFDHESESDSNVIEVYINRLRKKIGTSAIETHRGQGYSFQSR